MVFFHSTRGPKKQSQRLHHNEEDVSLYTVVSLQQQQPVSRSVTTKYNRALAFLILITRPPIWDIHFPSRSSIKHIVIIDHYLLLSYLLAQPASDGYQSSVAEILFHSQSKILPSMHSVNSYITCSSKVSSMSSHSNQKNLHRKCSVLPGRNLNPSFSAPCLSK